MAVGISKGDFESFSTTCLHTKRANKKGRTPKTPQRELLLICKFSQILCEINYYCYYFASFHKFYVKSNTIAINLQVFTNFM